MTKSDLEKELTLQTELKNGLQVQNNENIEKINGLMDRVEELTKQKTDLLSDLVQYRTATFRLHESNAALLTLINKHQV